MRLLPLENHLAGAADLLAARHRLHRAAQPLLPAAFEEPGSARKAIEALLERPGASGLAAVEGERVTGYLLGHTGFDRTRLRHVWVHPAGHAAEDPEVLRDLYAALAAQWVESGYFDHFVMAPATDRPLLETWYSLNFGQQQAHALAPITQTEPPAVPDGLEVRRATRDDLELLLEVADLVGTHLAASPCFGALLPESYDDWREGWAEVLADPDWKSFIALREGKVVSHALFGPKPAADSNLMIPDACWALSVGATRPEERGQGLARLMTLWGLHDGWQHGYRVTETDWRTANLPSSRTYPRFGYTPTFYRLHRSVDQRIAWARGR